MAIYTRNKKGNLVPLKIRAIKGEDGITPNIQIGEVTTLEPNQQATVTRRGDNENPIFDFGIPKGQDGTGGGSGGVAINDTTISKDEVWSSAKTEDFVLTNTDTVWTEVSGENLSIDYTKEGHLREVEIWGNTIQNEEDLSDIQHLGELYVDEEGEPILDSQGREQYKIEIESCNSNLFDMNNLNFSEQKGSGIYSATLENNTLKLMRTGGYGGGNIVATTPLHLSGKLFVKYNYLGSDLYHQQKLYLYKDIKDNKESYIITKAGVEIPTGFYYIGFSINDGSEVTISNVMLSDTQAEYTPHQSNKTTILLPCQLSKVGDVYDRLYWDNEKDKYIVEKNVDKIIYDGSTDESLTLHYIGTFCFNFGKLDNCSITGNAISPNVPSLGKINSTEECVYLSGGKVIVTKFLDLDVAEPNYLKINKLREYLKLNPLTVYYPTDTSQLIETDITEKIKLQTYKDKTHIFVSGNIDGSIKAKVPLDGGQAILSLSQENKELQEVNQEQDELINISLLATHEMLTLLEPLLTNAVNLNSDGENHIVNMYVAMVNRKLKDIEDVPSIYKEQVKEILGI